VLVEMVDSRLWTGLVSTRAFGQQASSSITYGDISTSLLGISMPWPVWLIYDLYPSLEAVAFALSGFDGGSDGIRKYVFITQQHVSIIGLVGFTTRRNTLGLDY